MCYLHNESRHPWRSPQCPRRPARRRPAERRTRYWRSSGLRISMEGRVPTHSIGQHRSRFNSRPGKGVDLFPLPRAGSSSIQQADRGNAQEPPCATGRRQRSRPRFMLQAGKNRPKSHFQRSVTFYPDRAIWPIEEGRAGLLTVAPASQPAGTRTSSSALVHDVGQIHAVKTFASITAYRRFL